MVTYKWYSLVYIAQGSGGRQVMSVEDVLENLLASFRHTAAYP